MSGTGSWLDVKVDLVKVKFHSGMVLIQKIDLVDLVQFMVVENLNVFIVEKV